uniref:Uncharacterized protein n=1 Tax=Cacopsylla melanoneura TaxID=428564 RepID=A0A8D9FBB0_9HEMI
MDEVKKYAEDNNCAEVDCEDVYVKDENDPDDPKKYQLVQISAADEEPAPPAPPAPTGWLAWFSGSASSVPNSIRKGAKRVNNYASDRNDRNIKDFHSLSNRYKSFQKDIQATADQSAASVVLSPVIGGLNRIGSAIDTSNHLILGSAHSGIDLLSGLTRTGLDFIKPVLKPTKPTKHQPTPQ